MKYQRQPRKMYLKSVWFAFPSEGTKPD